MSECVYFDPDGTGADLWNQLYETGNLSSETGEAHLSLSLPVYGTHSHVSLCLWHTLTCLSVSMAHTHVSLRAYMSMAHTPVYGTHSDVSPSLWHTLTLYPCLWHILAYLSPCVWYILTHMSLCIYGTYSPLSVPMAHTRCLSVSMAYTRMSLCGYSFLNHLSLFYVA